MVDEVSRLLNNVNQNYSHESNYITETMSEINDNEEISEYDFSINFKIIY